jgi:hypothetical protein
MKNKFQVAKASGQYICVFYRPASMQHEFQSADAFA